MQKNQILIVKEIRAETKGFKSFVFDSESAIVYKPGQFITLVDSSGVAEIRRSYSMVSAPVLHEPLTIAVKRIDNGFFSRKLVDETKPGDRFVTTGAAGFFCLPDNIGNYRTIFFFAAGSGITPVLSLIKTVLFLYPGIKLHLIYSNRSLAETAFYNDLKNLQKKYPGHLHIDFLFSSEADLRRARLNRELLLEFLTINRFDRSRTLFYTCGPERYMRMIIFLLVEEGFPRENIRKEDFNPENRKASFRMPPDKTSRSVHLEMNNSLISFDVIYPDSILRSAQKLKINLPYSCETGKCGSCVAQCKSGNVWMSANEVLTENDLSKGLVLTCTGHPVHADVHLKIG